MDFQGYELTPRRQELLTDILCSLTISRMTLLDACNLLCYNELAPDNTPRRSFFYSDQKAFMPFVNRLYTDFLREPGQRLAPLIKKKIGITVKCSATTGNRMLAMHGDKNNHINLSGEQGPVQLCFMGYPKAGKNTKRLVMGRGDHLFGDIAIHTVFKQSPSYPMMYALETLFHKTACLQSMASLFVCFMTDEIKDVGMVVPRRKWDMQANAEREFRSPVVERAVRLAVADAVFGIRDLFRSKDSGEVPDVTVDRDLLSRIVKEQDRIVVEDQKKDFRKRTGSSAGIHRFLRKEGFQARAVQLESRCGIIGSNSSDTYSAIHSTIIPDFAYILPSKPSTGVSYGTLHLGLWQEGGIMDLGTESMMGTTYDGSSYNLKTPYTTYSFVFQVLRLLEALRYFGGDTLEQIRSGLKIAEHQTATVYRFMNATRAVCAMELLANNV